MSPFYYVKNFTDHYEKMEAQRKADEGKTVAELLREDDEEYAWLNELNTEEKR